MPLLSDSVTASESLARYSDQADVNELLSVVVSTPAISVSDTTTTSELLRTFFDLAAVDADVVTVTDSVSRYSDQVDVNEQLALIVPFLSVTVTDSATTTESTGLSRGFSIQATDTATVSETVSVSAETTTITSDTVAVVDSPSVALYTPLPDMNLTVTAGIQQTGGVRVV